MLTRQLHVYVHVYVLRTGLIPNNFNTVIVCPIPKAKVVQNSASDFRPISISSSFATIFESLLLNHSANTLKRTHRNQFGYRANTSCKHAYFTINETIQYYNKRGASVFIASLDAEKAFDSLWRNGLYHKLMGRIPDYAWRALVNYYSASRACVRLNGQRSSIFTITGGVKQGGILSPFLFNFLIDDLLHKCTELNIGCQLGNNNVSILAYCDDIILVSSDQDQLKRLLKCCERYSLAWRMRYNATKSTCTLLAHPQELQTREPELQLYGKALTPVPGFTYLGLPIGNGTYVAQFVEDKFGKSMRALYSLNCFGCRPGGLPPHTSAFMFRVYCQPIVAYCLEAVHVATSTLKRFDSRQATLLKSLVGLSKYARSTPLLLALKVSSITQLYHKMKLVYLKQLQANILTYNILGFLRAQYASIGAPSHSAIHQLGETAKLLNVDIHSTNYMTCSNLLDTHFFTCENELVFKTSNFCTLLGDDPSNYAFYRQILRNILSNSEDNSLR